VIEIVKVTEIRAVDEHSLWMRFSDGSVGVRDFADILATEGPMVVSLRDPAMFKRVFLSLGVPTWPNGFDLDPINLHAELRAAGLLRVPSAV
jgi:hypothetical protein